MEHILVYGDSLSWGIIPNTRERLGFDRRWPGVMEAELWRMDRKIRVVEDCLNGRRTTWDDPLKPGRNGLAGLEQRIEINSPLALVMIMLGTNDFQSVHDVTATDSAQGLGELVDAIRRAPIEPTMQAPKIILIAPPIVQVADEPRTGKFAGATAKMVGLNEAIRAVAINDSCHYFDAGSVTNSSAEDGVHLDSQQHLTLGQALAKEVASIL